RLNPSIEKPVCRTAQRFASASEGNLGTQQQDARVVHSRSDYAERRTTKRVTRVVEVRSVRQIERLASQLELDPFGESESAEDRKIEVHKVRAGEDVSAQVAERSRRWRGERGRVVP